MRDGALPDETTCWLRAWCGGIALWGGALSKEGVSRCVCVRGGRHFGGGGKIDR